MAVRTGTMWIPLRRSTREAAGVEGTATLMVTLAPDTSKRAIEGPRDLLKALEATPSAWDRWPRTKA